MQAITNLNSTPVCKVCDNNCQTSECEYHIAECPTCAGLGKAATGESCKKCNGRGALHAHQSSQGTITTDWVPSYGTLTRCEKLELQRIRRRANRRSISRAPSAPPSRPPVRFRRPCSSRGFRGRELARILRTSLRVNTVFSPSFG